MTPNVRGDWLNAEYATATRRASTDDPVLAFQREFTKALHDEGVPLLAGTDSPDVPGMYPGYSVHDELRALVKAGLTPYDALSAATRVPGEFIAKTAVPSASAPSRTAFVRILSWWREMHCRPWVSSGIRSES